MAIYLLRTKKFDHNLSFYRYTIEIKCMLKNIYVCKKEKNKNKNDKYGSIRK